MQSKVILMHTTLFFLLKIISYYIYVHRCVRLLMNINCDVYNKYVYFRNACIATVLITSINYGELILCECLCF